MPSGILLSPVAALAEYVPLTTVEVELFSLDTRFTLLLILQVTNTSLVARTMQTRIYGRLSYLFPWALLDAGVGLTQPPNLPTGGTSVTRVVVQGIGEVRVNCRVTTGTGRVSFIARKTS